MHSQSALIAASQKRLATIRSTYRSQLENERIELLAQLNRSSQELSKSNLKNELLEVKAPSDGVVKDLAITAPGAVVQAGSLLLNIVPRGEPVQAEVLLSNEDVGFVAMGQAAQIKIAAYPFQTVSGSGLAFCPLVTCRVL
jgi:hemolysin D